MPTPPQHRESIVRTAAGLFRRQGYAATGINQILDVSGAPKGSFYHYFPQGKAQVGEEVVRSAGKLVEATLRRLVESEPGPGDVLRRYASLLSGWMSDSDFRDGGPATTTLLELAPEEAAVTAAGRDAFASWQAVLVGSMVDAGIAAEEAARFSTLAVAALEGALVMARVEQSGAPIVDALGLAADLVDAAAARHD